MRLVAVGAPPNHKTARTMQRTERETVAQRIARLREASALLAQADEEDGPLSPVSQDGDSPTPFHDLPREPLPDSNILGRPRREQLPKRPMVRRTSRPRMPVPAPTNGSAAGRGPGAKASGRKLQSMAQRPQALPKPLAHPGLPPSPSAPLFNTGSASSISLNELNTGGSKVCRHCGANLHKEPHRAAHLLNGCPNIKRIERDAAKAASSTEDPLASLPGRLETGGDKMRLPTLGERGVVELVDVPDLPDTSRRPRQLLSPTVHETVAKRRQSREHRRNSRRTKQTRRSSSVGARSQPVRGVDGAGAPSSVGDSASVLANDSSGHDLSQVLARMSSANSGVGTAEPDEEETENERRTRRCGRCVGRRGPVLRRVTRA